MSAKAVKPRSPEEFSALFPGEEFCILRVRREREGKREMVWCAFWTAPYFTSDTDRLVDHIRPRPDDVQEHYGATPEEALGKLAHRRFREARDRVAISERALVEAKETLEEVAALLGEEP